MVENKRRAMSLIEVVVSSVILGVVSIAYAGLMKAQVGQRDGYEELGHAMEIAVRQIEYLRQLDLTRPADLSVGAPYDRVPPFRSIFNNYSPKGGVNLAPPCPDRNNIVYNAAEPGNVLDSAFAITNIHPLREFLTAPTRRTAPDDDVNAKAEGNGCYLPRRSTVGPAGVFRTPELVMPPILVGRGYSCLVRASRVRDTNVNSTNPKREFQMFLVHYQINVFRNNRCVLVVPYCRAVDM